MEFKVDKLETEREFLMEMCPKDKRDNYDTGKETTLVRIIIRTVPQEYDQAVKSVRDMTKLRKYGMKGDLTQITNKEDNTRINYDDEWLPPYDELRFELINSYKLQERRRKELGKAIKKHPGHPVLPILAGHDQPGPHQRNCFKCGEMGHLSSDPICKAGPDDIWKGAPAAWKARRGADGQRKGKGKVKGKGNGEGKGKGKGKAYQRNLGDRKPQSDGGGSKSEICHNWSRGNGYCKYGPNCNYKHEGPQGGKKRGAESAALLTTGATKKARKKLVTLLVKDFQESLGKRETKGDDGDEDDRVYKLMRGAPTVIITRNPGDSREYRPKWLQEEDSSEEGMGYDEEPWVGGKESTPAQRHFVVTLMMSRGNNESDDEDYIPIPSGKEEMSAESVSDDSSNTSKGKGVRDGLKTRNKRNSGKMSTVSKRVPKTTSQNKNVDRDDRNINSKRMAVLEKRQHKNRNRLAVPEETKRNDMRIPSGGDTLAGRNNKRQKGESTNYSDTRDGSARKNKLMENEEQGSSSVQNRRGPSGGIPERETTRSKDLKTKELSNERADIVEAQARELKYYEDKREHYIEAKDTPPGEDQCSPDSDEDIIMAVKIKQHGTNLAYVDFMTLEGGWKGPFPLTTTLEEILAVRGHRRGYRGGISASESSSKSTSQSN
jgi:hypothetical protein